ncbi:MAG: site-specific DNA-methyltransferase [Methanobrevibacter sp.]|nr:site-specific DNA-methyltransferase [Methanobrevibacter sp.]
MIDIKELENKIINADCMDILKELPDKCIDLVLTDPPYGYLNTQFDKEYFDVEKIFYELSRVLKKDGLFVFSGRGDSFFAQNIVLEKLGLPFKEEIVWNKKANSSPYNAINRIHELMVIRGNKPLNKIKVPIEEYYDNYEDLVIAIKRAISSIKKKPEDFVKMVKTGEIDRVMPRKSKFSVTASPNVKEADRGIKQASSFIHGFNFKSIFQTSRDSVYKGIHPTQKPVKLFERMIEICSNENDLVLDCFSGSGTTAIACQRLNRRFVCIEKDKDYWEASVKRLKSEKAQLKLF